jgi:hypothetical protein
MSSPAKSAKELIAFAKANPGKLKFASSGIGSLQHFSWELFKHLTGTQLTHVPYKGAAASLVGMLAGEIQAGFFSMFGKGNTALSATEHGARVLMLEAASEDESSGNSRFAGGGWRIDEASCARWASPRRNAARSHGTFLRSPKAASLAST